MTLVMEQADGRAKLLFGAIALLRERGLRGTSFGAVVERTGAPRGSIYHHFPGGKAQLVEEAVDVVGDAVDGLIAQAGEDPRVALRAFVDGWRSQLEATAFRAGCPVVGVVAELGDDEAGGLAAATARAFERWSGRFATLLRGRGLGRRESERLATLVVAAIEGAVLLSRARRDDLPLRDVGRELDSLLVQRLAAVRDPSRRR